MGLGVGVGPFWDGWSNFECNNLYGDNVETEENEVGEVEELDWVPFEPGSVGQAFFHGFPELRQIGYDYE